MIINIRGKEKLSWLMNIFRFFRVLYFDVIQLRVKRQLVTDTEKLRSFFQISYPKLSKDNHSNIFCVSCDLCQKICPTDAIDLKKANMINFPKSLKIGESPMHFYLDVSKCIKCGECSDVCLVNAIEMTGNYKMPKVDLVSLARD